jgi:CBS domain-containing protein
MCARLVTERDLLRATAERGRTGAARLRAGAVMTRQLLTATPQTPFRKAVRSLLHNQVGFLTDPPW